MKKIFLLTFFILTNPCSATILSLKQWKDVCPTIMQFFRNKPKFMDYDKVLIVLDIDNVLLQENIVDMLIKYELNKKYQKKKITKDQLKQCCATLEKRSPQALVNPKIPKYIKSLQEYFKVICLTQSTIGSLGTTIESYENFRIQRLEEYGINFKNTFPYYDDYHVFSADVEQKTLYPVSISNKNTSLFDFYKTVDEKLFGTYQQFIHNSFCFKNGIIFANNFQKDFTLQNFLSDVECVTGWKPSTIVFIDDRKENINAMEQSLRELKIDNLLIHYTQIEYDHTQLLQAQNKIKTQVQQLLQELSST